MHAALVALLSLITLIAPFALAMAVLVSFYAAYCYMIRLPYKHIPGPKFTNFFMAHATEMLQWPYNRHLLWIKWSQECGPIYKVLVLHKVLLFTADPSVIKELCSNQVKYPKSREYLLMDKHCGVRFMGHSLLTTQNVDEWKMLRHGMNVAFHKVFLTKLLHVFNRITDTLIRKLDTVADGKTAICFDDQVHRASLDLLTGAAYSMDTNSIEDNTSPFPSALNTTCKILTELFHDPLFAWKPWLWKLYNEGATASTLLRDTGKSLIRSKKEQILVKKESPKDIFDIVIQKLGQNLCEEDLIDNFISFFVAGQETTAGTLAFLFSLYGRHPDVLQKVQQEIDAINADDEETELTNDMLDKMVYTEATIKETLRLYAPVPGTVRDTTEDGKLAGIDIPKNTSIVINISAMHWLSYNDGEKFIPERFLTGDPPSHMYMPFSLGQRSCIGRHFAMLETKMIIFKIIKNFDFFLAPNQSFDIVESLTMKLKNGVKLCMSPRKYRNKIN